MKLPQPYDVDSSLNLSPYRLSNQDEFPAATYLYNKTGEPVKYTYSNNRIDASYSDLHNLLETKGYETIFYRRIVDYDQKYREFIYSLDTTLIKVVLSYKKKGNKYEQLLGFDDPFDSIPYSDDMDGISANDGDSEEVINVIYVYSNSTTEFEWATHWLDSKQSKIVHKNKVSLVVRTMDGYGTERFELPKYDLDIQTNYGTDFIPIHEKIIDRLSTNDGKGLVLLHGTPGTGKTHYLKYIASQISNKQILFIPPFLADFLTSPDMIPFLIRNKNSILFIEDAEKVITDRSDTSSVGVANILNLTDGILSDILNIQIVATFNMDKQKIDPALLRKGRLIAEHEFSALSVEMSNELLKKLGSDVVVDTKMTLTEIYNIAEPEFKEEVKSKPKIGF
jgi:hypothetical protein